MFILKNLYNFFEISKGLRTLIRNKEIFSMYSFSTKNQENLDGWGFQILAYDYFINTCIIRSMFI